MTFFDLNTRLQENKLYIFSLREVENLFSGEKLKTISNNLSRWIKMGRLVNLRKNLYELITPGTDNRFPDLYIANRLYAPSYVSLETALSVYGLIPDVSANVTSLTTRLTREFKNKYGLFIYRSCQKRVFTGYRLMLYEGVKVYLADPEKALVDFIYFTGLRGPRLNFTEERLNKKLLCKLKWSKVLKYSALFNSKTDNVLKELREWAKC